MRTAWRGFVLGVLGAMLAACGQLVPNVPASPNRAAPASTGDPSASDRRQPVRQVSSTARAATAELGVQIYWHEVNDPHAIKANARRLYDYIVDLGANSVGISFPIYTDGGSPTRVYPKAGVTPTPESLQTLVALAKQRGLRVMLRPLIDEGNIKNGAGAWRGSVRPRDMRSWFASYRKTIMLFLDAAQKADADVFVIGAELDSLVGQRRQWRELVAAVRRAYDVRLAYGDNWGQWITGRPGVPEVENGLDAYPQLPVSDSSSVEEITTAWTSWLKRRSGDLPETIVHEIGIAATPGAYQNPAAWGKKGQRVAPKIQSKWFAGACAAVKSLNMPGIYFWTLDAWADPAKAKTYDPGSFIGRSDSAIRACFAKGWPGQ